MVMANCNDARATSIQNIKVESNIILSYENILICN